MTRSKDTEMQDTLKKLREKEEENAVIEYKNKLAADRQAARAAELDELRESLVTRRDEKGNPTATAWSEWTQQVDKATAEPAAAFNSEWRICMLNLVNMLSLMVHAVDGSLEESLRIPLKQAIIDGVFLGKIKDSFIAPPSEISLPSLEHNVSFTDDNKLKIASLARSDLVDNKNLVGKDRGQQSLIDEIKKLEQALQETFEKGVVRWLKDNHYKPHPTEKDQFVHETTGKLLDKSTFDDLKNDPVNGLQNYLSETTDLSFTPSR